MTFGIAAKLGLLLSLVGVVASGLTGYYAFEASRNLLVASAKNELLTATKVLSRQLGLSRADVSRDLVVMARYPAALAALQPGQAEQQDQLAVLFKLMMQANPSYFQIRLISADASGLEMVRIDRDGSSLVRVTGDELQEKGHFPYVFDTLTLPAGDTYLSRIVVNHERGIHAGEDKPTVQLAMPVMGATGTAQGVLVVNVDLQGAFAKLTADLPSNFRLYFANRDGDYLIHPDPSKAFGFDRGRRELVQMEFPQTLALVEGKVDTLVLEAREDDVAATPIVAAFVGQEVAIRAPDERSLILGLAQPLSHVVERADTVGTNILRIVLGFCLACILLAWGLARAVTRPINVMGAAMQGFAQHHQLASLPIHRQDELGVLARSFSQMQSQITSQMSELRASREEMEHMAKHDMLTGLPNRRMFMDRLEHALDRSRRSGEGVALLFVDLDNFKEINDRWGHDAGDKVLKTVASRLSSSMRKVDTVARLGGDEFVVLLDNPAHREHVAGIAAKLLESLNNPISLGPIEHCYVGASIGISQFPQDGGTASDIISNADRAMYETKAAGRNHFRFFS